jgi:hypothetical protein
VNPGTAAGTYTVNVNSTGFSPPGSGGSPCFVTVGGTGGGNSPCTYTFTQGAQVGLDAVPPATFSAWSGDCTGTATPTSVTMDGDKACGAAWTP